jgi:hypothetical protein
LRHGRKLFANQFSLKILHCIRGRTFASGKYRNEYDHSWEKAFRWRWGIITKQKHESAGCKLLRAEARRTYPSENLPSSSKSNEGNIAKDIPLQTKEPRAEENAQVAAEWKLS